MLLCVEPKQQSINLNVFWFSRFIVHILKIIKIIFYFCYLCMNEVFHYRNMELKKNLFFSFVRLIISMY